jgi:UDP-perosamine 4-acetyltransferase
LNDNLLILGDGHHASSVRSLARDLNFVTLRSIGLEAARNPVPPVPPDGPCHFDEEVLKGFSSGDWQVALGRASVSSPAFNVEALRTSTGLGYELPTLCHPKSHVSVSAQIGRGSQIFEGVVVKHNSVVAAGCILQAGVIVEHDCLLGPGAVLAAGAILGGRVRLDQGVFVGLGSILRDGIRVGESAVIGMGSVVVENVPAGVTVLGNPARAVNA